MPRAFLASVGTSLPASADHAWRLLKRRDAFLYVACGAFGFSGSERCPEEFREDQEIRTRLSFSHAVPAWEHRLRLVRMDDARRELLSRGRGGFVRSWEHRIGIEPEGPHRCRYTDEVGIEAGIFAAAVWAFARLFYRQGRLRRFIHNLPVSNSRGCGDRPCIRRAG